MNDFSRIGSDLEGRRAIVTGGATGIGLAIATTLAAHGVMVAIADLSAEGAEGAAAKLGNGRGASDSGAGSAGEAGVAGGAGNTGGAGDAGGIGGTGVAGGPAGSGSGHRGTETAGTTDGAGHFGLGMDVSRRESVEAGFAQVLERWGGYDILIANAGVSTMNRAVDLTDEEWDFNFNVNTRGIFLTNQAAARHFTGAGHKGVIVNTASLAAKVGAPLLAHYSASKFAVLGWTQALARELAPAGVRVNAVCPGFVRTSMQTREIEWESKLRGMTPAEIEADYIAQTPLGRIETPEDVAGVVAFLCSDAARFMTGQGINVTGGVYMG
ncbi:SDR family oxidoreductase [Arsenicitalea aurantiaca]|uniref:SDR family oxidoreductase n=1 Tax=Arsenicitalea aurantiaca TaxID=1783274 RepID=A0A433XBE7_9HYPH|nr:SDR family NAD(P)-dependent oxidoreductase [Arsenicitalea aurantiaca]RUT31417.1 SDR family oxidoreductase [Arsenicitalea aurantiaca]